MNIPIISYFLLKGKCNFCQASISIQYPVIEFVSAVGTMLLYLKFGLNQTFAFAAVNFYMLLAIAVIDLNTQLILNRMLLIWLSLNIGFFIFHIHIIRWNWMLGLAGGILGLVFYYFIAILGKKMFHKESLGMGDVKFAFVAGFILGVDLIIPMTVIASVIAIIALLPFYLKKVGEKQVYVPFGPFLCMATYFLLIYGDWFRSWYYQVV
jgi:leader peptidase (prepilin peptidase)/N-methyltransferase